MKFSKFSIKKSKKPEIEKLKRWYEEELARKDKVIDELKHQNTMLMKASIKGSGKLAEITEKLKRAVNK
ncbi:hypothetical protein GOV06_02105 [Candidatus Woesearchaeota archaeon]|nr:hypothetical protein [Candidatus Woesearchaeota archaeon]